MLNVTSFSVPISSIEFWEKRLNHFGVEFKSPQAKFQNASVIACNDRDSRSGYTNGHIPLEHPIKGFYGVEIWEEGYERTAGLLTGRMDHSLISEESNRFRFVADDSPGQYIDIVCAPDSLRGLRGGGTVHHIAFATSDTSTQLEVRTKIIDLNPTPLIDRQYFKSVYFREPGGVLFEIATIPPGFSVDEAPDQLGTALKLPPQYEPYRDQLERVLVPVSLDLEKY